MVLILIIVAWLYVALMMAVAEATATNGTVLGAVFTFLLYGVAPLSLVVYLAGRPARRRARERREAQAGTPGDAASSVPAASGAGGEPDGGGEAPAGAVPPVRKEP